MFGTTQPGHSVLPNEMDILISDERALYSRIPIIELGSSILNLCSGVFNFVHSQHKKLQNTLLQIPHEIQKRIRPGICGKSSTFVPKRHILDNPQYISTESHQDSKLLSTSVLSYETTKAHLHEKDSTPSFSSLHFFSTFFNDRF
jgi:hypothetical protein